MNSDSPLLSIVLVASVMSNSPSYHYLPHAICTLLFSKPPNTRVLVLVVAQGTLTSFTFVLRAITAAYSNSAMIAASSARVKLCHTDIPQTKYRLSTCLKPWPDIRGLVEMHGSLRVDSGQLRKAKPPEY